MISKLFTFSFFSKGFWLASSQTEVWHLRVVEERASETQYHLQQRNATYKKPDVEEVNMVRSP